MSIYNKLIYQYKRVKIQAASALKQKLYPLDRKKKVKSGNQQKYSDVA